MPGVTMKSMSRPSSLKYPRSRAASTGRSCTAFMIATWGFFLTSGFRVASWTVMAFSSVGQFKKMDRARRTGRDPPSSHQIARVAREEILDRRRPRKNALFDGARDQLLQRAAIGLDSVGEGIASRDFHDPAVHFVGWCRLLDLPGAQLLDVKALGFGEGREYFRREIRVGGEKLVLHHHAVVDRVVPARLQRRAARFLGVRDE